MTQTTATPAAPARGRDRLEVDTRQAGLPERDQRPLFGGDALARAARRCAQALIVLAAAYVLMRVVLSVRFVVIPVLLALIIAAALRPAVAWLQSRKVPGGLAALAVLLGGLALLGGMITLVVRSIASQADELISSASQGLAELEELLVGGPLPVTPEQVGSLQERAVEALRENQSAITNGAFAGAATVAEVISGALLLLVVLFFLLKDAPGIGAFLLRFVHRDKRDRAALAGERAFSTLAGYARGTAVVAVVDAVFIGIALVVLGVPLAIPLSAIVFLGAFVPLIGATVAGFLCAVVALVTDGPLTALIVVAVVVAVNQIEGDVLAPIVFGRSLRLHPLVILLALAAGTVLGGIVGAVLSVPVAAVVWAVVTTWWPRVSQPRGEDPGRAVEKAKERDDDDDRSDADRDHGPVGALRRALSRSR